MAELVPAPFADLVTRLYREPELQDALFELRRNRWYVPSPDTPDTSVRLHGRIAGNPLGPAAGPHTQMAQNILLSYVAGGRILELKTVQVNDRLAIPRPCIDVTNVGYNVEWSQELLVEQSLREYVAGAMLIHMFRHAHPATADAPAWREAAGEVIYDISVGYDLAGIRGEKVVGFLRGMREAGSIVRNLRSEISDSWDVRRDGATIAARDLDYPTCLSNSITLSTFHGCPADEIERICEFLIGEMDFDVIVKMNPPMLGQTRLEKLLHDVLGYRELTVNPEAYRTGLTFDEGTGLCRRLTAFAASRGRGFGAKFSNTLEVVNHRDFFTPDNKVMYLSGQPLHVITLTLADEFRRAMGPAFPISFSAGIDAQNFPLAAACGFVPITVSTDLLRPGGYGRLPSYLENLAREMRKCGASTIDEYILKRCSTESETRNRARDQGIEGSRDQGTPEAKPLNWAGFLNTTAIAETTRNDPRYRADANRKVPKRIDSHLTTFDCITCDKCLPVCPNAANFTYPTPIVAFDYHDIIVSPDSTWRLGEKHRFEIKEAMQIACYADFCNECGNCDTFCPEYGGPYIKKPTFFGSVESWERAAPRDGFVIGETDGVGWIRGRVNGRTWCFERHESDTFYDGIACVALAASDNAIRFVDRSVPGNSDHVVVMSICHTMRHLLEGIRGAGRVNQLNAAFVVRER